MMVVLSEARAGFAMQQRRSSAQVIVFFAGFFISGFPIELKQVVAMGDVQRFCATVNTQLGVNILQMKFNRSFGDIQCIGYGFIRPAQ
ncbi:MAG: hypothetical protein OXI88_01495 [Gammaproteobacteria bacterium]|nr:hypothetical protein [Gammaproteobacteria bacterium]MDE0510449.1 hypothetical protein [Gammaproteobacteria bacterium]